MGLRDLPDLLKYFRSSARNFFRSGSVWRCRRDERAQEPVFLRICSGAGLRRQPLTSHVVLSAEL
jgi:hypothetical protein